MYCVRTSLPPIRRAQRANCIRNSQARTAPQDTQFARISQEITGDDFTTCSPLAKAANVRVGVNSRLRRFASATPYDCKALKADMIFTAPTAAATHVRLPQ
jgi:hypothetical protein